MEGLRVQLERVALNEYTLSGRCIVGMECCMEGLRVQLERVALNEHTLSGRCIVYQDICLSEHGKNMNVLHT
jgi:hypothetical protein